MFYLSSAPLNKGRKKGGSKLNDWQMLKRHFSNSIHAHDLAYIFVIIFILGLYYPISLPVKENFMNINLRLT